MAKKKETEEQVEQLEQAEEVVMTEQTVENEEAPLQEVKTAPKNKKTKVEIPAMVDSILKSYPDYKELYVDKLGGVFTADTQPSLVKDAILYQNPYYNK